MKGSTFAAHLSASDFTGFLMQVAPLLGSIWAVRVWWRPAHNRQVEARVLNLLDGGSGRGPTERAEVVAIVESTRADIVV
jgi:hypothetical protein